MNKSENQTKINKLISLLEKKSRQFRISTLVFPLKFKNNQNDLVKDPTNTS